MHHHHDLTLVILSVVIAIFASYTALDLANSIFTTKGRLKWIWLIGGSLAMGVGIWSMHFVGMLAFSVPNLIIYYDVPLMTLSILVAIVASALALFIVTKKSSPTVLAYTAGSLTMGLAIAGMHYIGIWSMRMNATIQWDWSLVALSIVIAIASSAAALMIAFKLRDDLTLKGFLFRTLGGVIMGFAIAGMHYTAMSAMHLDSISVIFNIGSGLLATEGLALAVIIGTIIILSLALTGSNIDRALSRKTSMNEALKDAIRARDEFLSIASHELRTPLTSIKLQIEMIIRNLNKDDPDLDKVKDMLSKSDSNIGRINHLVEDMLDISRLATGRLKLQKERFDLNLLVSEVLERLQPVLNKANCEIIFHENTLVEGEWDKFRVEQIITNILTNAAKYAPGQPVIIDITKDNELAKISIKDQGRGISKEDQERIFLRFERADGHEHIRGLGLGLYIVKEIVDMHGGEISVESEPERGAEFIVELPLKKDDPSELYKKAS